MLLSCLADLWRQVLPIGVARIRQLVVKSDVPPSATFFATALFAASGLFNVVVYTTTRPGLLRPSGPTTDRLDRDADSDRTIRKVAPAQFRPTGPRLAKSTSGCG